MKWPASALESLQRDFGDAVHESAEARYLHRLHCVKLVSSGCKPTDVAEWFDRPVRTVERWVRQYNAQGADGLIDKPRQGRPSTLDESVLTQLAVTLSNPPQKAGFDKRAWTGSLLQEHLQAKHGIELSLRQTQRLLKRVIGDD